MLDLIAIIIIVEIITTLLSYGLIFYVNIWIYYSQDSEKFPLFPILNPFLFKSYDLMLSAMFTFKWKEKNPNLKLKKIVNKTSRVLGILILSNLITIIVRLIIS
ncbi:MAG: hypothetical protein K9J13_12905 [Saprospiraceae bacterium]|nr:hypothetical protein [Saprospiraceae bacterium]